MIVAIVNQTVPSGVRGVEEFRIAASTAAAVSAFVNEYSPPLNAADYLGVDTGWAQLQFPAPGAVWAWDFGSSELVEYLPAIDPLSEDVHIYVSEADGHDVTGNGTIGNPFKDFPRAVREIRVAPGGITWIHFKPGDYTHAELPVGIRGSVIAYADDTWDPDVYVTDFSGTTDSGSDFEGINDTGLTATAFRNKWLEITVDGVRNRRMVNENTTTRITPSYQLTATPSLGTSYRIFHSDVRMHFVPGAENYSLVSGSGIRRATFPIGKQPIVCFIGIDLSSVDENFMGSQIFLTDSTCCFYGVKGRFIDNGMSGGSGICADATQLYCGTGFNRELSPVMGTDDWEGWGLSMDTDPDIIDYPSGGELIAVNNSLVDGYISSLYVNNSISGFFYSPALFSMRGGRQSYVYIGRGGSYNSRIHHQMPSPGQLIVASLNMLGGAFKIYRTDCAFISMTQGSYGEVEGILVLGEQPAPGFTVDVQGASILVVNGQTDLGRDVGDDWRVGTTVLNKSDLTSGVAFESLGSVIVRIS